MSKKTDEKFKWTPKTIIFIAVIILILAKLILDISGFFDTLGLIVNTIVDALGYILTGFIIAYVLNAYYIIWTDRVFKKLKSKRLNKILSVIITYMTFFGFLVGLVFLLIPTLTQSVKDLINALPDISDNIINWVQSLSESVSGTIPQKAVDTIVGYTDEIFDKIIAWASISRIKSIFTATFAVIFNAIMGVIISVYMLWEKEKGKRAATKIVDGLFSEKNAASLKHIGEKTDMIFKKYFAGKILQSISMLIVCLILFSIFGIPYFALCAVVIAITNLIPYIGPWAGAVPVVALALSKDLKHAIFAVICICVAQAIDNWVVGPRISSQQLGVSPLLVLGGLCIGGALFGIPGMVLGDVAAALIKVFFYDEYLSMKIEAKKKAKEESSQENKEQEWDK